MSLSLRDPVKRARTLSKDWARHMVTSGSSAMLEDATLEALYIDFMAKHGFAEEQARAAVEPVQHMHSAHNLPPYIRVIK